MNSVLTVGPELVLRTSNIQYIHVQIGKTCHVAVLRVTVYNIVANRGSKTLHVHRHASLFKQV